MPGRNDPTGMKTVTLRFGFGLPENVCSAALEITLREAGISAVREPAIELVFHGRVIGCYRLDFLVEDSIVLELKAGAVKPPGARAQVLTYLRAARKREGFVLFFGPSPDVKRVVL